MPERPRSLTIAALVAVVFGVLTVVSGGLALFAPVDMGAVVPFVLMFNFGAGFAYVIAGLGLWRSARWAMALSVAIAAATALVFALFLVHVWQGGTWEPRTLAALIFRLVVWVVVAAIARSGIRRVA
jgi:hypothetical protein